MPEIALFGEWDTSNLGDRAIHEGVLRFSAECGWTAASYAIGSLRPVEGEKRGGPAPAHAVPPLSHRLRVLLDAVPPAKRTLRALRQRMRMNALLPRLERAQAILVGGGALLSDWNLHFPQSLAVLADAARRLGKPMFCLGCGAEGDWSAAGERKLRAFLGACTLVAVRDEATAARVAQVLGRPVPVFGDFCLSGAAPAAGARKAEGVSINVQQLAAPAPGVQARYEAAVVVLAQRLRASHGSAALRIFTTGSAEDAAPARRVAAQLGGQARLVLPTQLEELLTLLDRSELVIASRLHAGVLALDRGVATAGFSGQPKLNKFLGTFGLGADGFGLDDADRLLAHVASASALAQRQRERLAQAPMWQCRADVFERLATLSAQSALSTRSGGAACT